MAGNVIDLGSSKTRSQAALQIMADRLADPVVRLQVVAALDALVDRLSEVRAAVEDLEGIQGGLEDILQVSQAEMAVREQEGNADGN